MPRTSAVITAVTVFGIAFGLFANDKPAAKKSSGKDKDESKETILSPESIMDKKVEGKATVELTVGEAHTLNIDSVFMPGAWHAVVIRPKVANATSDELMVIVSREAATRLLQLGIQDPTEHFRGKLLRVSGNVERLTRSSNPSATTYRIQVTNLDQLESIRKP